MGDVLGKNKTEYEHNEINILKEFATGKRPLPQVPRLRSNLSVSNSEHDYEKIDEPYYTEAKHRYVNSPAEHDYESMKHEYVSMEPNYVGPDYVKKNYMEPDYMGTDNYMVDYAEPPDYVATENYMVDYAELPDYVATENYMESENNYLTPTKLTHRQVRRSRVDRNVSTKKISHIKPSERDSCVTIHEMLSLSVLSVTLMVLFACSIFNIVLTDYLYKFIDEKILNDIENNKQVVYGDINLCDFILLMYYSIYNKAKTSNTLHFNTSIKIFTKYIVLLYVKYKNDVLIKNKLTVNPNLLNEVDGYIDYYNEVNNMELPTVNPNIDVITLFISMIRKTAHKLHDDEKKQELKKILYTFTTLYSVDTKIEKLVNDNKFGLTPILLITNFNSEPYSAEYYTDKISTTKSEINIKILNLSLIFPTVINVGNTDYLLIAKVFLYKINENNYIGAIIFCIYTEEYYIVTVHDIRKCNDNLQEQSRFQYLNEYSNIDCYDNSVLYAIYHRV